MLNLLLELLVSVGLCGVLVFFAFLNAPAEAGPTSEDEGPANMAEGAYEPALLPAHELPLHSVLSRYINLSEDTPCGMTYRWVLMNALHYAPHEIYSEDYLREWGSGVGDGESENSNNNSISSHSEGGGSAAALAHFGHVSPSPSSTPLPAGAGASAKALAGRRTRRRPRRGGGGGGGAPTFAAPPTPLRRESAHWVNVVLRWAAFLCLGGGTVKPEVWTDHLLYHTEKVVTSVNAGYAEKMRARAALVRMMGYQLTGGQQQLSSTAAPSSFHVAKPLVRVELMELGAGLLGGPARELRRPPLSSVDGLHRGGITEGSAPPGTLSPSLSAVSTGGGGSGGNGGGATTLLSPTVSGGVATAVGGRAAASGALPSTPPPLLAHVSPTHTSAIAAASVLLSSSMSGLSSVVADVVSSVTTGNNGITNRGTGAGDGSGNAPGSVTGDFATTAAMLGGSGMGGNGAQLGVVLPRVEGDVISVEEPLTQEPTSAGEREAFPATTKTDAASSSGSRGLRPPLTQPPPLRCFAVPLFYDDQRFHLRLGCCLPLGALLPISLCVPPDVLTLDCAVAVRRIIFNGYLYAAMRGANVELSFPVAPQFTAVVSVTPDYAGNGRRDSHNSNQKHNTALGGGGHGPFGGYGGGQSALHSTLSSAGAAVGAKRAMGHTFTAVNTTRNEMTAVRDGGREASPSARPPMATAAAAPPPPPRFFNFSSGVSSSSSHNGGGQFAGSSTTTAGTSSINEKNEKVQEVVLLALHRLIQSLTYPNVLAGQLVCVSSTGDDMSGEGGNGAAANKLSMKWQRTTASLPLRI